MHEETVSEGAECAKKTKSVCPSKRAPTRTHIHNICREHFQIIMRLTSNLHSVSEKHQLTRSCAPE